jgi:hypothetical protein
MIDSLKILNAELAEGATLLRPHFPGENGKQLRTRARHRLQWRYKIGHWPTNQEIEEYNAQKAKESDDVVPLFGAAFAAA